MNVNESTKLVQSEEKCVAAGTRCPANHISQRSFSQCNSVKFFPNQKTCKDVSITDATLAEGTALGFEGIYQGLMPNHTVSMKANSGCKFTVSYDSVDAPKDTYGGFNFMNN